MNFVALKALIILRKIVFFLRPYTKVLQFIKQNPLSSLYSYKHLKG